jgi:acylphosphatase
LELGMVGVARNLRDGRVEIVAEGTRAACEHLVKLLRSTEVPGRVDRVVETWAPPKGDLTGFVEK